MGNLPYRALLKIYATHRTRRATTAVSKTRCWTATIILAGALTQVFCYRAEPVASCNWLPVSMLAGTTDDEAAQHENTTFCLTLSSLPTLIVLAWDKQGRAYIEKLAQLAR
ncbi:hypothetical protein SAMN04487769_0141 [Burkholderia sp. b14]|nr:hypothetical protein SAMN04487769_0141 [Burkholderia sp. b14]